MTRFAFQGLVLLSQWTLGAAGGKSSCPCATEHTTGTAQYKGVESCNGGNGMNYHNGNTDVHYCLPEDYGLNTCQQWDAGVPECVGNDPAIWCADMFCFVEASCTDDDTWQVEQDGGLPSLWFPESGLMYSYATCGTDSYFAKDQAALGMTAVELKAKVEEYAQLITDSFEEAAGRIMGISNEGGASCSFPYSCPCTSCLEEGGGEWKTTLLDLRNSAIVRGDAEGFEQETECLAVQIESDFKAIAQQAYNDPQRAAYMYFGVQENGSMIQWPAADWCPSGLDFRLRPWYAAAASGPKDVVLVLDNSGSMAGSRWEKTLEATAKVLLTLTEYDYVALVLFSSDARVFEPSLNSNLEPGEYLRPATETVKEEMVEWIGNFHQSPMGNTNFEAGFQEAFRVIHDSRNQERTTRCQAAILFMTDGEDTSGFSTDVIPPLQEGLEPEAVIFTYAFGDDADTSLPKDIACSNKGIFYSVGEDANIGTVMSKYYTYFAAGVEKNTDARWTLYTDALLGVTLMSACRPSYHKPDDGEATLLGVGCVDINLMITIDDLREKATYDEFMEAVRDTSSMCPNFNLDEATITHLRDQAESSCEEEEDLPNWVLPVVAGGSFLVLIVVSVVAYKKCCKQKPAQPSQHPPMTYGTPQLAQPAPIVQQTVYATPAPPVQQPVMMAAPQQGYAQPMMAAPQPVYAQPMMVANPQRF